MRFFGKPVEARRCRCPAPGGDVSFEIIRTTATFPGHLKCKRTRPTSRARFSDSNWLFSAPTRSPKNYSTPSQWLPDAHQKNPI
ncbi:hypothetical protein BD779DRAFT_1546258 [Infundibulicybe gibba]|nr:hypothetical protein BD779DRAFT_1546258 [Infundibulicybe gibba]